MRLLLVGGGHTHLVAMPMLRRCLPGWRIALLSPTPRLLYSGMMPGWVAGQYRFDECAIDLPGRCRHAGIEWIEAEAVDLRLAGRQVVDSLGRTHAFDVLSLDVGAGVALPADRVPPATDMLDDSQPHILGVKPFDAFAAGWRGWLDRARRVPRGRRLAVVGGGAAAVELALALARRVRDEPALAGSSVHMAMSEVEPLAGHCPGAARLAERSLRRAGVALLPGHVLAGYDARGLRCRVGGRVERLPVDLAIVAIGPRPLAWLRAAARREGLALTDDGAIAVDSCLRSISHPAVHACGDCAGFVDQRVPRSGVHALRQAGALAESIARGRAARPYRAQRHTLALLNRCDGTAIAIRGPFAAAGRWAWLWKDRIDRRFVAGFLPPGVRPG